MKVAYPLVQYHPSLPFLLQIQTCAFLTASCAYFTVSIASNVKLAISSHEVGVACMYSYIMTVIARLNSFCWTRFERAFLNRQTCSFNVADMNTISRKNSASCPQATKVIDKRLVCSFSNNPRRIAFYKVASNVPAIESPSSVEVMRLTLNAIGVSL